MSRPLFSVIVPTYNRLDFLPDCIQSVRAQTFRDFELVVVDDGSTDGSYEYVVSEVPEALIVQQSNAGPGAARNAGAHLASGEFLAFLDSDDLWFPWTLETYARVVDEHHNLNILLGKNIYFCNLLPEISCTPRKVNWNESLFSRMSLGMTEIPTASSLIRRSLFFEIGGFSEIATAEDVDLWLRSGCALGFVEVHSPILSAQRVHSESLTRNINDMADGLFHLIESEYAEVYPGGEEFKDVRLKRISMASRSIAFQSISDKGVSLPLKIYARSFYINFKMARFRFILGFPIFALARYIFLLTRLR